MPLATRQTRTAPMQRPVVVFRESAIRSASMETIAAGTPRRNASEPSTGTKAASSATIPRTSPRMAKPVERPDCFVLILSILHSSLFKVVCAHNTTAALHRAFDLGPMGILPKRWGHSRQSLNLSSAVSVEPSLFISDVDTSLGAGCHGFSVRVV